MAKLPTNVAVRPALWRVVPHAVFMLAALGLIGWLGLRPNQLPPQFTHIPEAQLTIGEHGSVSVKPILKPLLVNQKNAETIPAEHGVAPTEGGKPVAPGTADQVESNAPHEEEANDKPLGEATTGELSPIPHGEAITQQTVESLLKILIQPGMAEDSTYGPLPHKDINGRSPWQAYGRPFSAAEVRPRIAIILTDLGYQQTREQNLIAGFPRDTTLAFNPYGADIMPLSAQARQLGFETLLQLDLDAGQTGNNDAGPLALRSNLDWPNNQPRLYQTLGKTGGYTGILGQQGQRFLRQENNVQPLIAELSQRGLLWVEPAVPESATLLSVEQWQLPYARVSQVLDVVQDPDAVDLAIAELLTKAKAQGRAIGVAKATPMMQERLVAWQRRFADANVVLAPVSAVMQMGAAGQISAAATTPPPTNPPSAPTPVPASAPNNIVPGTINMSAPAEPSQSVTNTAIVPEQAPPTAAPTSIAPQAAPASNIPTSIAPTRSSAAVPNISPQAVPAAPTSITPPAIIQPAPIEAPISIAPETATPAAKPEDKKANTAIAPQKH